MFIVDQLRGRRCFGQCVGLQRIVLSFAANSTNVINAAPALTTVWCATASSCVDGDANGSLWTGGPNCTASQFSYDSRAHARAHVPTPSQFFGAAA